MNVDQPWATLKKALGQRACKDRQDIRSCKTDSSSDSSSLMGFSATCFYFAQELTDMLGGTSAAPPIGLVHVAWGGSTIEQWLSNSTTTACDYR
eukprot:SAG31_NODE_474_length_15176_cov_7.362340_14_plen_94_part_00